jgi:hypothetical protein
MGVQLAATVSVVLELVAKVDVGTFIVVIYFWFDWQIRPC